MYATIPKWQTGQQSRKLVHIVTIDTSKLGHKHTPRMLQAPIKQYQAKQYFSFCARSSSAVALGSAGASFILIKSIAKKAQKMNAICKISMPLDVTLVLDLQNYPI